MGNYPQFHLHICGPNTHGNLRQKRQFSIIHDDVEQDGRRQSRMKNMRRWTYGEDSNVHHHNAAVDRKGNMGEADAASQYHDNSSS